jgi:DNA polymerase
VGPGRFPAVGTGPGVTPEERAAALDQIAAEVRVCTACRLHRGRTHAVPGEGDPETEVVFVGEGPGQNEDQQGRPFVGAAGGLLEELLGLVGWRRTEVFITNVVKCRPPGNRDPEPDEIAACAGFLRRQLAALDPAVVVTLGRYSLGTFMPGAKISSAHGTTRPIDPSTGASNATAFAMYHPAAAFRQTALKETLVADMAGLPQVLLDARAVRQAGAGAGTARAAMPGAGEERASSDTGDVGATQRADDAPAPPEPSGEPLEAPDLSPDDIAAAAALDLARSMPPAPHHQPVTGEDSPAQMTLF